MEMNSKNDLNRLEDKYTQQLTELEMEKDALLNR